jgi:hypothetical protein
MRGSLFQITTFIEPTATRAENVELPLRLEEADAPHKHVDLTSLVTVEATGVCIPTGTSEVLLASLYKSPVRA